MSGNLARASGWRSLGFGLLGAVVYASKLGSGPDHSLDSVVWMARRIKASGPGITGEGITASNRPRSRFAASHGPVLSVCRLWYALLANSVIRRIDLAGSPC
jgi:hypothetical protein